MDNRKLTRIDFNSDVELINNDVSIKGVSHNLSIGGMFIETSGKLEVDTNVTLWPNLTSILQKSKMFV